MRISAKGRYTLASAIEIARYWDSDINISSLKISASLGISKIFLDQCLASLKNAGILVTTKGQNGGYRLSRSPKNITSWDILSVIETALQENHDSTCTDQSIELAINSVFSDLDYAIRSTLIDITLDDLLKTASNKDYFMLYM